MFMSSVPMESSSYVIDIMFKITTLKLYIYLTLFYTVNHSENPNPSP